MYRIKYLNGSISIISYWIIVKNKYLQISIYNIIYV